MDGQTGCFRKKARTLGAGCYSVLLYLQKLFLKIVFPLRLCNAPNKKAKKLIKRKDGRILYTKPIVSLFGCMLKYRIVADALFFLLF